MASERCSLGAHFALAFLISKNVKSFIGGHLEPTHASRRDVVVE